MSLGRPINLTANIASKSVSITATAEQTEFSPAGGYRIDQIAVYRNGTRLVNGQDFTARDGATVTLVSAATIGDTLEFQIFDSFNVANTINTNSSDQTINGSLTVTNGITGATIGIQSAGTVIGAGKTINFIGSGNTVIDNGDGSISVSIAGETAGINTSTTSEFTDISVSGVATVGSAVTINSTGIHAVSGVITASSFSGSGANLTGVANTDFINATQLNVIGIATVGTGLTLADNVRAKFGNDGDLEIYHTGSESHIQEQGTGGLILNSSVTTIKNPGDTETIARFTENGGVDLNFDNSTKFATHNTGVKVTGIATISSDLNVAGITTVGILTAYSNVAVGVGATIHGSSGNAVFAGIVTATTLKYGSTSVETAIDAKASTGKAIAMAMVFGF